VQDARKALERESDFLFKKRNGTTMSFSRYAEEQKLVAINIFTFPMFDHHLSSVSSRATVDVRMLIVVVLGSFANFAWYSSIGMRFRR
jgi:hypothetical protein